MSEGPVIIGVTGGSGSGKTSVCREIFKQFQGKSIMMLEHDSYYKDQSHMSFEERLETNYDHPLAFDTDLLIEQLKQLMAGEAVDIPVYDYTNHTRSEEVIHQEPKEVIILEGIMILENQRLRDLMDIKIFVDTDDDLRIIRRIQRDMTERGRSLDSIIDQYLGVVKKMHEQFIEPTKKYADVIIPEGAHNTVAIDLMVSKIRMILNAH
ncbi:uridine kinase [Dolosigranulum pigrum]|jgi:uridine kinase|uniref:Uridine kinase n=4 Tax=Dolosigranulum TaxID=29393 RepID=H3NFY9_9LACT|nr:uridine kinase [Dolosigranulum pigrum]DAX48019.1 MAG TPA: uridine/cytidine kinase [Caudoviricetes sp.]EHR32206.1 uridine kinase [Dolosigranulum pigrum ATCC 51524]QDO91855.1 uridine kinase [Dolosigranulum pigrum]QTJ33407.1 uridine kinase [Dolosigranulum pigrum]QTJ35068.1 uridine kinase [Dolosigranulum pigrum]